MAWFARNGPTLEEFLMFTSNPFVELTAFLPPIAMQVYIVLMILAVVIGTILDMLHKNSGKFSYPPAWSFRIITSSWLRDLWWTKNI